MKIFVRSFPTFSPKKVAKKLPEIFGIGADAYVCSYFAFLFF